MTDPKPVPWWLVLIYAPFMVILGLCYLFIRPAAWLLDLISKRDQ